jgi:hypothetical protein
MSETSFETSPDDQVTDARNDEVTDIDQEFGENGVDMLIDTSYSPPERPLAVDKFGTTAQEMLEGESLDQRLAQEEPDPNLDIDLVDGEPSPLTVETGALTDDVDTLDPLAGELPDAAMEDGILDDGEVGDARAGRLVDPDQGFGDDVEKDLIGFDVGVDAGAASAEEAAMHVIGESEVDRAFARDRAEGPTI